MIVPVKNDNNNNVINNVIVIINISVPVFGSSSKSSNI